MPVPDLVRDDGSGIYMMEISEIILDCGFHRNDGSRLSQLIISIC